MKRKLAMLDPIEDMEWVELFNYAKVELHYGDERADAYAWRWLVATYPRLAAFDGCKPGVRKDGARIAL